MTTLTGRRAIVTGAAQGIGKAIAERLAAEGAAVALIDLPRQREKAEQVAAELRGAGATAVVLGADVSVREQVVAAYSAAREALGGIDVVVNNAGIVHVAPLAETTEDAARRLVDVNILSVLWGIQAATELFVADGTRGTIINACSNAGHLAVPMLGAYSATKFAVRALTQAAAQELASKGITVNSYSPGIVETDMWGDIGRMMQQYTGKQPTETFDEYAGHVALGRPQTGADVADLVAFLAGPGAGYITGQSIITDGGMVYA